MKSEGSSKIELSCFLFIYFDLSTDKLISDIWTKNQLPASVLKMSLKQKSDSSVRQFVGKKKSYGWNLGQLKCSVKYEMSFIIKRKSDLNTIRLMGQVY